MAPDIVHHDVMTDKAKVLLNILLTLVWVGLMILIIGYPSVIGLSRSQSTFRPAFALGLVVCVVANVIFIWFGPKERTSFSIVGGRLIDLATTICIFGCFI